MLEPAPGFPYRIVMPGIFDSVHGFVHRWAESKNQLKDLTVSNRTLSSARYLSRSSEICSCRLVGAPAGSEISALIRQEINQCNCKFAARHRVNGC